MEKRNTKELILDAALELFSQRGYDGVGVAEIAAAVGIKGSALYNHFKGKEEILSRLIDTAEAHYQAHINSLNCLPDTVEELVAVSLRHIEFTLNDPGIIRVRRLLNMEQYRNKKLAGIATHHFNTAVEQVYTDIFAHLTARGLMGGGSAGELAFAYTAPVSMMVQLCDREPDKKAEAMEKIRAHIALFIKTYACDATARAE